MSDSDTKDELRRCRQRELQRRNAALHKDETNARLRERYATDPDYRAKCLARNRRHARKTWLKAKYGLSLEDYDKMLARQGGLCANCGKKSDGWLAVDHCHITNKLRALLCKGCNTGLGYYKDNPVLLRAAATYIETWRRIHARLRRANAGTQ
jgi:hypothetical protein